MSSPYRIAVFVLAITLLAIWGLPAAEPPAGNALEEDPFADEEPSASQPPAKKAHSPSVPKRPRRSGEAAIKEAFTKPVQLHFVEMPLNEVIDDLRNRCGIEMQLDIRALNDVGIETDTPITLDLQGTPLRSALNHMLREYGLTWTIRNDVLLITTPEQSENMLCRKVYDVADLVVCRDDRGVLWDDYDTLIDVICNSLVPTSWDCVGGPGTISGASLGKAKVLVVVQTFEIQEQVASLLAEIREVAKKSPDAQIPLRNRPPAKSKEQQPMPVAYGTPGVDAWTPSSNEAKPAAPEANHDTP